MPVLAATPPLVQQEMPDDSQMTRIALLPALMDGVEDYQALGRPVKLNRPDRSAEPPDEVPNIPAPVFTLHYHFDSRRGSKAAAPVPLGT
jgi:hypothetical protein